MLHQKLVVQPRKPNAIAILTCMFICLLATICVLPASAQAQSIRDSAKWIPSSANYVAIVRAKRIFDSPIAQKEKWKSERAKAFKAGLATFPATAESILFASQIDFEFIEPIWSASIFKNGNDTIDIVEVSKRTGGNIETLSNRDAIALPNDTLLVQVEPKTMLSFAPANRQMISRLVRSRGNGTVNISSYLSQAIDFADQNADIIIAFDIDSVVPEDFIAARLRSRKVVEEALVDSYAKTLVRTKGVTLGITIKEKINGVIKIDFHDNPEPIMSKAKAIFIGALNENGLMIDELSDWVVSSKGNQIFLKGEFSVAGLQQIASLVEQPIANQNTYSYGGQPEVNELTRSKQYFSDIEAILDRLRNKDLKSLASYSKWFDRYSREIDGLPILGVDEKLLEYGTDVASRFRAIAGSLDESNYDRADDVSRYRDTTSRYGRYSYHYDNSRNRQIASSGGTMQGANEAKKQFREIGDMSAEIRKLMTQKFNIEF